MCHPAMVRHELALAEIVVGELTELLFAGLDTTTDTALAITVRFRVLSPKVPVLSHALTITTWLPTDMLRLALIELTCPALNESTLSTYICHPAIVFGELAEAVIDTGEQTVELLAGLLTVTVTVGTVTDRVCSPKVPAASNALTISVCWPPVSAMLVFIELTAPAS